MAGTQNPPVINQHADSILSDFYDSLFVQCLLQHAATARKASSDVVSGDKKQRGHNEWHTFLDNLCSLCDWRRAGKTVVSIGAQELDDSVVLRLSARPQHREQAGIHLDGVIASLKASLELTDDGKLAVAEAIASSAIECSKEKVCNYYNRLCNTLSGVRASSREDSELVDEISRHMPSRDRRWDLCSWAYEFRLGAAYPRLQTRMSRPLPEGFFMIHHFIGRLGCWHKASWSLVRHSSDFADILRRAHVIPLETDESGYDPRPRLDEDLERLASKVFPNFRGTSICSALVHSLEQPKDLLEGFKTRPLKCQPHAEAVLTDWFYRHRARFVHDDRYVGCSKRSCFCCALYMKLHPAKMQERPSHGNVWVQWLFPRHISLGGRAEDTQIEDLGMMVRMTSEIRRMIQGSLTNTASFPRQRFESTTGISASLRR